MSPDREPTIYDLYHQLLQSELKKQLPRAEKALKPRIKRGVIRVGHFLEEKKINWQTKALKRRAEWQKRRVIRRGQRRAAEIQEAQARAERFLEVYPYLMREAEERRETLPKQAGQLTRRLVEGTRAISFTIGLVFGKAMHLIWNSGFYLGQFTRELAEKAIEKIEEKIEARRRK
ncbi:MAG: hypothetical protein ACPLXP_01715 [Microgenomates group bacterium]